MGAREVGPAASVIRGDHDGQGVTVFRALRSFHPLRRRKRSLLLPGRGKGARRVLERGEPDIPVVPPVAALHGVDAHPRSVALERHGRKPFPGRTAVCDSSQMPGSEDRAAERIWRAMPAGSREALTRLGSRSWTFGRLNTLACGFTSPVDEICALKQPGWTRSGWDHQGSSLGPRCGVLSHGGAGGDTGPAARPGDPG